MNPLLTEDQFNYIADMLANWEKSTDEELRECMGKDNIADVYIEQALSLRSVFFTQPFVYLAVDIKGNLTTKQHRLK